MAKDKAGGQGGAYFAAPTAPRFFTSGCGLLDCVLGGGWAEGRILNIVGDKSTGKTLLAIEAAANFAFTHPKGTIHYNETEAAFDRPYAAALGMPLDRVRFVEGCATVEDVFDDLEATIKGQPGGQPGLYILDSLDAVSDRDELARGFDEASYGARKAQQMSKLFRQLTRKLAGRQITVMIISQVRDAIGVKFGRKTKRSGGRALDFYASQVLYLAQLGTMKKVKHGQERATGIHIRAKLDKSKVGLAFRECEFPILFGYGIDDVYADLVWLGEVKRTGAIKGGPEKLRAETYAVWRARVAEAVRRVWVEIEMEFMPRRNKYGG